MVTAYSKMKRLMAKVIQMSMKEDLNKVGEAAR